MEQIRENDIRPEVLFNKYLELARNDAYNFFPLDSFEKAPCPGCESDGLFLFKKHGFQYKMCEVCLTIYADPRPTKVWLDKFYKSAPSTKFWATDFYKKTESARREKLWRPKAEMTKEILNKYAPDATWLCDIGAGYGVFCEEYAKISNKSIIAVEPSPLLAAVLREKGFLVLEKVLEDIDCIDKSLEERGCFVSFELFEHLQDPNHFLKCLYKLMNKGDILIMSTLSGMGLDIQVLGENSDAVSPPHHLNFLNPKSISLLLGKIGLEVLEITTPGKLDVDILQKRSTSIMDSTWNNILKYLSVTERKKLQSALVDLKLSSHMLVVCRKC